MGILVTSPDHKAVLSHKLAPGGQGSSVYDLQLSCAGRQANRFLGGRQGPLRSRHPRDSTRPNPLGRIRGDQGFVRAVSLDALPFARACRARTRRTAQTVNAIVATARIVATHTSGGAFFIAV